MDLQPYLPLNTEAKIDALIADLPFPLRDADWDAFELAVVLAIRKLKMQLYFKQRCLDLRSSHTDKRVPVVSSANKQSRVKSLVVDRQRTKAEIVTCHLFIGLKITEVAEQLGISVDKMLHFLDGQGLALSPDSIFTSEVHALSADFVVNFLQVKNRKEKLAAIEQQKLYSMGDAKAEKFKPSYGREGNYSKLIYTRPKS